jgi:phosphoesterase RecJ-like protein
MTLKETAEYLKANDDYLIVSHEGPDADGLGAAYALCQVLRGAGKRADAVLAERPGQRFAFIDQAGLFRVCASPGDLPWRPEEATVVVVDTHDIGYLGPRMEKLVERASRLLVIDHHDGKVAEGAAERGPRFFVDQGASSCCELVCLLAEELGIAIGPDAAEALFAGIVYDTGSFIYPKTTERTFACALGLMRQGVRPNAIHQKMYESSSSGLLLLQARVLSSLELAEGGRVAIQVLRREDLSATGSEYEDAEDIVNIPLQSSAVEVSVFFKENLDGRLRCSLRSKGKVNVAGIAQNFGGGGHKTASGFSCARPLESMKAAVLESIIRALES